MGRCAAGQSIQNENRLFGSDVGNRLPSIAYMTPEYYDQKLMLFKKTQGKDKMYSL